MKMIFDMAREYLKCKSIQYRVIKLIMDFKPRFDLKFQVLANQSRTKLLLNQSVI